MSVFSSLQPGLSHKKRRRGRNANFLSFHHQSELISPPLVLTKSPSSSSEERRVIPYSCMRSFGRARGGGSSLLKRERASLTVPPSLAPGSPPSLASQPKERRSAAPRGDNFYKTKRVKRPKGIRRRIHRFPREVFFFFFSEGFSQKSCKVMILFPGKLSNSKLLSFALGTLGTACIYTQTTENVRGTKRRYVYKTSLRLRIISRNTGR